MLALAAKALYLPYAARLAALALGYFVVAKATLVFAIPPGYATAVWPPSGIALAAILFWGVRCWPGIWLGAALTNYSIDLSMPAALGIAAGNTLEAVCAVWLVEAFLEGDTELRRPEAVFLFALLAALASVIAATAGVTALLVTGAMPVEQYLANWYTWWQGDTTGILIVTPCVLVWSRAARSGETQIGRASCRERVYVLV